MNQSEQRFIPSIVLVGDNSRYDFLCWLTGADRHSLLRHSIWVKYDKDSHFENKQIGDDLLLPTTKISPGLLLYCHNVSGALGDITVTRETKYFVFEEFPFRREDTMQTIQAIYKHSPFSSITVILMDLPRRHGSTDDIPSEVGIIHAKDSYQQCNVDVSIAKDSTDISRIINNRETFSKIWDRNADYALQELKALISDIDYDFEFLRTDFEYGEHALLSHDKQELVCSYSSIKKYHYGHIWENFEQALYRLFFPNNSKQGVLPVVKLYSDTLASSGISESFSNKDSECFLSEIKLELHRKLSISAPDTPPYLPQNEEAFYSAINQPDSMYYRLDILFWNEAKEFVATDLLSIMKNRLNKRTQQLEDALL